MTDATFSHALDPAGRLFSEVWWLVMLRGVAAVAIALVTFAWPGLSLLTLVVLYGAYAIADGVVLLGAAFRGGGIKERWWFILAGLIGIFAGLVAWGWPGMTAIALVVLIGAWSIARGLTEMVGGVLLRRHMPNEWSLFFTGALSVIFGLALVTAPGVAALALLWLFAAWSMFFGVLKIAWGFRLKQLEA